MSESVRKRERESEDTREEVGETKRKKKAVGRSAAPFELGGLM